MDIALELLRHTGLAAVRLFMQPFYYMTVLFIILLLARQTRTERRLFHVKLTSWPKQIVPAVVAGLLAGLFISAMSLFIGFAFTNETVYWLWGAAVVLVFIRIRYFCIAYSAAVIALLSVIAGLFSGSLDNGQWYGAALESLAEQDGAALLLLAGLLHMMEALLLRWQGDYAAGALIVEGKRGLLVGGYQLPAFWPVPMLLLVPASSASAIAELSWTPGLAYSSGYSGSWTMLALPVVVGFSSLATSRLPRAKARKLAGSQLYYSVGLIAAALLAVWWEPLVAAAAAAAFVCHELIYYLELRREEQASPVFVHDAQGLRVLAVVPGMPADQMGIQTGEILHKVNGTRVRTTEDLYNGLQVNSAFCKMEIINHEGHVKFVQRARFEGEHHQLGVVLAPDEGAPHVAGRLAASLVDLLRGRRMTRRRETTVTM
ncbi:PDZ domain-containing protein [Paenibacillus tarimensis]|uniref:PDZ domain-containing protein n=1 Tax=Paenibacillus tarimensis TaxID=416012 RepID=UPI001F451EFC|nr:PDZ domain-containing protein [Paenibacillus tarimensis]MCF2944088.1 PDZ domain-containing protein [Paenibacillus tarimensis]